MGTFSIAALQLELAKADNTGLLLEEIRGAHRRFPWVDLIVLPELASFGPDTALARPLPDAVEERYCELAAELGVWLIPGTLYERLGDAVFNTAPVIDPQGKVVARYRKMFPWLPYERGVAAGSDFVVVDVPEVGRIGVSICYDGWFPETTRSLVWMGAEIIVHPTLTSSIDRDLELAIARSSAACNQCYFVDVNTAGQLGLGRSIVCGPGGEVIHQAGSGREVFAVRLDLDHLRRCRDSGWHGLGQPLKGFRDCETDFPCYPPRQRRSVSLDGLGAVRLPRQSITQIQKSTSRK
ncbi:MAG TPA: carbon-nitrogen hydrolase family protein [Steroidobacteraceae bacterium]|nr:carbon-nitrogen hydrolase family protein [Steroidobacteraceae bacterium]